MAVHVAPEVTYTTHNNEALAARIASCSCDWYRNGASSSDERACMRTRVWDSKKECFPTNQNGLTGAQILGDNYGCPGNM